MFEYKKTKKSSSISGLQSRMEKNNKHYSNPVALNACLDSLHVCACDVVKLQKHGGCVPGMELENVPVPLSLASEEEPLVLCSCPRSAPAFSCQTHSFSFPPRPGGYQVCFEGGAEMRIRKAGICKE